MELPQPRPVGVRAAKESFSTLLEEVAAGGHALIYRRSRPVAALIPVSDLERLQELARRDEELGAVIRARGHEVDPWGTPEILRVLVTHLRPVGAAAE
jgi:prevent-host-death family protein